MGYYQSTKEEIRRRADIVALVGQFVQLRKAGRNHVGLCPFHTESAPSFTVNPAKQIFHCFGCKRGGDIFAFWMEYHGTTFPEAVKELAERYNVPLSDEPSSADEKRKAKYRKALFEVNEQASLFFHKALKEETQGKRARAYLKGRSISKEIISQYRLGYAPDSWDKLANFLTRKFGNLKIAAAAGLVVARERGGYYDRFRNRVVFPISNLRGQIVGFGGRVLDDSLPKYLNSPESPVFHKGSLLYGLNHASGAIRKAGRVVIVEGYMDFLALRKHGLEGVVATLGTALTSEHVRRLKGYATEAVVVFDSDRAGKTAALKSLPLFLNEGLKARAVVLPEGHDPDSFVHAEGLDALLGLIQKAGSVFDFYVDLRLSEMDGSIEGKVDVIKEILPALSDLRHSSQQSLYVGRLSERLGVKEDIVWQELKTIIRHGPEAAAKMELTSQLKEPQVKNTFSRDLHLLNLLIHHPEAAQRLSHASWQLLLTDGSVIEIAELFFRSCTVEGSFKVEEMLGKLESEKAREKLREGMLLPSFYSEKTVDLAIRELEEKIRRIALSRSIQKARQQGDIRDLNRLLKRKAEEFS